MEKISEFVQKHPWGTAGIVLVVGLILIYLFVGRGGGTAAADPNAGYYNAQAAAIQSGGQVYATQIAAQADVAKAIAGITGQLAAAQEQGFTIRYGENQQTQQQQISADAATALAGINAGATVDVAKLNADASLSATSLNDAAAVSEAKIAGDVAMNAQLRALQTASVNAEADAFNKYTEQWFTTERFVASPAAGTNTGAAWGSGPGPQPPATPSFWSVG